MASNLTTLHHVCPVCQCSFKNNKSLTTHFQHNPSCVETLLNSNDTNATQEETAAPTTDNDNLSRNNDEHDDYLLNKQNSDEYVTDSEKKAPPMVIEFCLINMNST